MPTKRKRHRRSETNDIGTSTYKQSRGSHNPVKSGTTASSQYPSIGLEATPIASTSIRTAVERAVRVLPPPEGLDLIQRKLWRELTRNAAASIAITHVQPTVLPHAGAEREYRIPASVIKDPPVSDKSIDKNWSTTKLAPKPQRNWYLEKEQDSSNSLQSTHRPSEKSTLETSSTSSDASQPISSSDAESGALEQTKQRIDHSLEVSRSPRIHQWRDNGMENRTSLRNRAQRGSSNLFSASTPGIPVNATYRRSSFGQKASSVPSYSGDIDTASAFKRFTAFLRGRGYDSSDDDSDESEVESHQEAPNDTTNKESVTAERLPPNSNSLDGSQLNHDPEPSTDQSSKDSDLSAADVTRARTNDDQLPYTMDPDAGSTPTIRANVGIKRQIGPAHVMNVPSSTRALRKTLAPTPDHKPPAHLGDSPHDSDNDFEDVLQNLEEVSRNIFATTRRLPASKLPLSPDPKYSDLENGILTFASSDRRVTRSMSTSKKASRLGQSFDIPLPKPAVFICNSVHVPDTQNRIVSKQRVRNPMNIGPSPGAMLGSGIAETPALIRRDSTSSLSELSRTPSPPPVIEAIASTAASSTHVPNIQAQEEVDVPTEGMSEETPHSKRKRRMTGMTSRHFTPEKRALRTRASAKDYTDLTNGAPDEETQEDDIAHVHQNAGPESAAGTPPVSASTRSSTARKRKGTGKKSSYFTPIKPPLDPEIIDRVDFYNSTGKNKRVPAGVSTAPVPPISSARFGIIQERLWKEPFWLLIAVTFLNKTAGRAAAPVFWELKKQYPTPKQLAEARLEDLQDLVWHLGLQRQRSKRLIAIATAWVENPPVMGKRWRTLHYPDAGDGKAYKQGECIEEDEDECAGALEIGHIPGCGPYAWDSWRIFCRDALRGLAEDYDGKGAGNDFVPEWRKVLPLDKELRACLRWMWLREGWIWNHETGKKRRATAQEMKMAEKGEMEVPDEGEKKFAALAAGVENVEHKGSADSQDIAFLDDKTVSKFGENCRRGNFSLGLLLGQIMMVAVYRRHTLTCAS